MARRAPGGQRRRPLPLSRSGSARQGPGDGVGGLTDRWAQGDARASRLPNGVEILTEHMAGVRSVAVGAWVRQGSAHESPDVMGVSHLLEHMVFKGTSRRTPKEIALSLESLGGSLDAYTSREQTSFQARVLDEHLPEALDVLADLVREPCLRDEDLDLERDVVLEEIAMVEDTPDDLVFELHGERLWGGHPYGNSILGTRATVSEMKGDTIRALHEGTYSGENIVVAAAGRVAHEDVVARVAEHFGDLPAGERQGSPGPLPTVAGSDVHVARAGSQTHVVFGTATPGHSDPARYPLAILSAALGAGMSSRLFQRIREELALCYTVYSYQSFYALAGVTGVYVGTRPEWADRAVDAVREVLADVARNGLDREELIQTKQQVKGHLTLSLESPGSRLHRLAAFALYDQPFTSLDETLARIDAVDGDQVRELAERAFDPDRQIVLRLGPQS